MTARSSIHPSPDSEFDSPPDSDRQTEVHSPLSPRYSPAVLRLRKLQIVSVVVGVHFGLIWLMALSWQIFWLAYLSVALLAVAWMAIPVLGILAMWYHHREKRMEQH